jgi:hypothetical protein
MLMRARKDGERVMQILGTGLLHQITGNPLRNNLARVQDNNAIAIGGFINKMSGPKGAYAFFRNKAAHVPENVTARFNVETNGWLIKKQKSRVMNEGTGDFYTPHLSAGQIPGRIICIALHSHTLKNLARPFTRFTPANSVQRSVIIEVLGDRKLQVKGARLKHDPQQAKGRAWITAKFVIENADLASLSVEEPGDQGKKRALSGTVEAQKYNEFPLFY